MLWLLMASLSVKGRLSSIICSIIRRDQRIIWNILWVNPMSTSHLSYKRTNLPAYIIHYSSWYTLTFLPLSALIKYLRLRVRYREFNYIQNGWKSPAYGFQGCFYYQRMLMVISRLSEKYLYLKYIQKYLYLNTFTNEYIWPKVFIFKCISMYLTWCQYVYHVCVCVFMPWSVYVIRKQGLVCLPYCLYTTL